MGWTDRWIRGSAPSRYHWVITGSDQANSLFLLAYKRISWGFLALDARFRPRNQASKACWNLSQALNGGLELVGGRPMDPHGPERGAEMQ